jgi:hypothetical protein
MAMKLSSTFLLIALTLICGVSIGYYLGHQSKNKKNDNTEVDITNLSVYDGPFGLSMGLSLDDVKQVCKIKHIENDACELIPPKNNDLFETYIVWIDPVYGLYGMRAISENIATNAHGTELKARFENIVESISNKYGKYKKTDKNSDNTFDEPRYFMHTLQDGSRELSAVWAKKHQSQLPDNILGIAIEVIPENAYSNTGYVTLEYGFSNSNMVKAKADTVF